MEKSFLGLLCADWEFSSSQCLEALRVSLYLQSLRPFREAQSECVEALAHCSVSTPALYGWNELLLETTHENLKDKARLGGKLANCFREGI
jgi:hypothetical protein